MNKQKKSKNEPHPEVHPQNFLVVGVGASAGGLDSFKALLKGIPKDSGMAYVLVQHLSASQESLLPDILSRVTSLPVHEIVDEIQLSPDHIYILPPNKTVTNSDGKLLLAPRDNNVKNLPVDIFFSTLAEVHKHLAIGIVLSGTGNDGTFGLKKIREYGGTTIAEDPETAAYDGMPVNAINADVVDMVLPAAEIPQKLLKFKESMQAKNFMEAGEDTQAQDDNVVFRQIIALLRHRSGIDFTYYKQPTQHRRIARRMALSGHKDFKGYLDFLRNNKTEQDVLYHDLLIPVTSFFRDPKTMQLLCEKVLPVIIKNKTVKEAIRVWVAGCSTGQEAYSIAICLHEFLETNAADGLKYQVQLFASDVSEPAISKARTGSYNEADLAGLSEEHLRKYFKKTDGHWQVTKVIRDGIVFAQHNFLKDPPFGKMDLISCRNSLIYMDSFLQKKALTTFHYSLNENGVLLLGKSETTTPAAELFTPYSKQDKIYTRKSVPGRPRYMNTEMAETAPAHFITQASRPQESQADFKKNAEAVLLAKHTPAAVIINEQMDIVHIHGDTTPYLQPQPGKPTFNLLKMAKNGLAFELRNALHKSKAGGTEIKRTGIPVPYTATGEKDEQSSRLVCIEVVPLANTLEPHTLVLFSEMMDAQQVTKGGKGKKGTAKAKQDEESQRIAHLEKELAQTREDMRSITEEQEASNEELQSANEELQSSSEELQSVNEELETSKEELQSSNEELVVINQELVDKQEQLNSARLYAESIISTLREPLIVMNTKLVVKTANYAFYKKFKLAEPDTEGKLFTEIQNKLWNNKALIQQLQRIIQDSTQVNDFELHLEHPSLGKRYLELNARRLENERTAEPLILLAIEDITEKKLNAKLLHEHKTREMAALIRQMIWTATPEGVINYVNHFSSEYSGFSTEELQHNAWQKLVEPSDLKDLLKAWKTSLANGSDLKMEVRLRSRDGSYYWHLSQAYAERDERGKVSGWIWSHTEIHSQKLREQEKDDFISIASHELKTPLSSIKGFAQLVDETLSTSGDKDAKLLSSKMNKQVDRLIVLVKDLLDVTRIQEGKIKLNFKDFSIDELIEEMVEMIHGAERNQQIVTQLQANKKIHADRERISQVIANLVSNAVKYSSPNEKIIVTSSATSEFVKVSIQDFGIGIEPNMQKKVFERFYRVKDKNSGTQSGMGLGLYISCEIIKRHGGQLEVISEKGLGSTFYFTIPLSEK